MNFSTVFLLMSAVLIAPHLSLFDGKLYALIALALAVVFWIVELWIDRR